MGPDQLLRDKRMGLTSDDPSASIREEYVDNEKTDVELEETSSGVTHDPWDPEQIRIHTRSFSLRQIVDMIDDKEIDLAPDFQRQYVWKDAQRWGLIESLLLGIPLPSFYFNEDREGLLQVVDGVQRLTTIHEFYKEGFVLGELAYLKNLENKSFGQLDGVFRRRLQNTQFVAHVIDPQTPYRVKFDVFRRINTGGTPLSAQEIRHCMSLSRSRDFLKSLVDLPEFKSVMGHAVLHHRRMADREIALRLVAFHVLPLDAYAEHQSLDAFLGQVTENIDRRLSDAELGQLIIKARTALINAKAVFEAYAFRKWPLDSDRRNPINRTLVESWGTALALHDSGRVAAVAADIQQLAREMMTTNDEFVDSISGGTGDPRKVKVRMTMVAKALAEALR
jgi:hypothetical protein